MILKAAVLLILPLWALAACTGAGVAVSGGGGGSSCTPLTALMLESTPQKSPPHTMTVNTMPVTVGCGYQNEPCVSVTICEPGTSNCQTIPNVLLDTGSYGLRLFSCSVGLTLSHETDASGNQIG